MTKLRIITKRTLSVLLCMVMVLSVFMSVPFTASAAVRYSFEENGIRYLELDDSTVSVVGANPETMPVDVVIPSAVQGKTVTTVGERAFENSTIKSIILPETVTTIGYCAFKSARLESVTILGNMTTLGDGAFVYCSHLKEVNLPDSITHIGASAFWGCKLENFQLPKNLESIGESAFRYYNMEHLTIPSTVHTIGDYAFDSSYYQLKNIVFEERTTPLFLGQGVFSSCTKLTSVTFPDNINITFGNKAFLGCKGLTNVIFPDNANITLGESEFSKCTNLKTVKLPNNITAIPNNTFKDCTSLESVQGGKIASIGNNAFENCTSITNYDFSYCTNIGSGAFSSCKGLTSITFPDNANVTLGESVFLNCTNLKTVTLSQNITAIPNNFFKNCTGLESVQGGKITSIGNNAFENCKSIINYDFSYCTNIGDYAFMGCTGLTFIAFPENIDVVLGKGVFSNCTNLKTVKLPNNINAIPAEFFLGCTSLESIQSGKITSIGYHAFDSCTSIANYDFSYCTNISGGAFSNCTGLTSVTLPDSVVTFGEGVFQGCTNLKTINLPDAINTIPRWCFSGCTSLESIQTGMIKYVNNWAFYDCKSLKYASFTKENIIAEIGMEAFSGCSSLTEFSLPKVKYIQNEAFKNCTSLVNVDLSKNKSLYEISQYAFYNCTSLESIDIPSSCREIWFNAFMNCESLYEVNLKSGLEKIGEKAFFNCHSLYDIVIPKSVESIGGLAFGCYEKDGKYYSYGDFIVAGVKSSLADEYAEAYNMYWALNAPKLTKIENTSSGVKITFSKSSGASSGKYEVYRCTDSTEWKLLGTTTSLSYTDKTAKAGTKYYYTVQFIGKPTNSINDYPLEMVRLSTPKVSKITNTNSGPQLTWGKVTGAKKYNVYVKSGSSWKKLGDTTSTTFTHTAAKSGTSYTYTVRAYDSSGNYKSGYVTAGYKNKFVAPPAISSVSNTSKGVKITWGKVSGAVNYRVFVKSGSSWKKLADTTKTSYTHTTAKSGTKYTYTVRCISSTGKSYVSGYDKVGTSASYLAMPKVSKISNTQSGAKLTWGKIAGAKKYNVYVKSGSKWKKLGESTTTSYTHTTAKSGTTYSYRVRAYDSTGKVASAYKSAGDSNKFIAPPAITSLTSTSKGVKITWGKVTGAVNYRVFVKSGSKWKKLADTTSTSFVHKSAKNNKSYTYTVRCISSTGKSYVSDYDKVGTTIKYKK